MFLYPPAITLIAMALCGKLFEHDRAVYMSVTAFTCAAALFDFLKALPEAVRAALHLDGAVSLAERMLPFYSLSFGWVVPAAIGLVLGLCIRAVRKRRTAQRAA